MTTQQQLIESLESLGISPTNYRVLAVLPMVFVAWADGRVQRAERKKIIAIAKQHNFLTQNSESILEDWLHEEPSPDYFELGFRTLVDLARHRRGIGSDINAKTLEELIDLSFDVAKAAGGLFGQIWNVSSEEEVALARIASALSIDDGDDWNEFLERLDA